MNISNMDNVELEIYCDYFNDIIQQAVIHGGDGGGAYYSNYEELEKSILTFVYWLGLKDKVVLYKKDNTPILLIKENLNL